jgi:hypothetical protein
MTRTVGEPWRRDLIAYAKAWRKPGPLRRTAKCQRGLDTIQAIVDGAGFIGFEGWNVTTPAEMAESLAYDGLPSVSRRAKRSTGKGGA